MAIEVKIPPIGESINEVTLAQWLVNEGDYVEMDQPIAELESDKATLELPAEQAGTIHLIAGEGEDIPIGAVVASIDPSEASPSTPKEEVAAPPQEDSKDLPPEVKVEKPIPSPAAAKILAEKGISPESVQGTGKQGRITKADALHAKVKEQEGAVEEKTAAGPATQNTSAVAPPASGELTVGERTVRRERMSRLRRTIAGHLVKAKNQTAMLTTFNEVNMQPILDLRAKYKEAFKEKYGVSLGFMGFFLKAGAMALQEFELVNAQLDNEEIIYHNYVDISIAVAAPKGLVTPVVRNVHRLSLLEIEREVKRLAIKARDNQLALSDLEGGTFTVSNGGVFGSLLSTPILNIPQTAILGMHKIQERPMAVNGEVKILPMMYLALSYDHRLLDGKEAVTFLVRIKELLEDPIRMMIGI